MSKKEMNINVSGKASFGAVVQGDNARVNATASFEKVISDEKWHAFLEQSALFAQQANKSTEELAALRKDVERLCRDVNDNGWIESSGKFLELLYKAYGWAAQPLRALFGA